MSAKRICAVSILLVLALSVAWSFGQYADLILNNTPVQVYFSPEGGCTDAIVKEIRNAISEIPVQAYSLTSKPIAKALLDAHNRGIKVEAIVANSAASSLRLVCLVIGSAQIVE